MKKNQSGDYVAPEINVTQCSVEQGIAASEGSVQGVSFDPDYEDLGNM